MESPHSLFFEFFKKGQKFYIAGVNSQQHILGAMKNGVFLNYRQNFDFFINILFHLAKYVSYGLATLRQKVSKGPKESFPVL